MVVYVLLSITLLYLLFAVSKDFIYKFTKIKICSICAAVSLTWVSILVLKMLDYNIDALLIAILMGQSIAGTIYYLEKRIKNKVAASLSKLIAILLLTPLVYYILK